MIMCVYIYIYTHTVLYMIITSHVINVVVI